MSVFSRGHPISLMQCLTQILVFISALAAAAADAAADIAVDRTPRHLHQFRIHRHHPLHRPMEMDQREHLQ